MRGSVRAASVFSVRFADDDRAYSGEAHLIGKDQIVFLHGGTLARYDLKTKKPVWSEELISKQQIADAVKAENDSLDQASAGGNPYSSSSQQTSNAKLKLVWRELSCASRAEYLVGKGDKLAITIEHRKVVRKIALRNTAANRGERRRM